MAQLTERPADWVSTAPIVVENSRRIAAPIDTVWARIADHESWPEWFTDLSSVTVTFAAEGVGGGRDVKVPGMTVKERFTAWEPPHRFAFTLFEGPRIMASMAESVVLEPDGAPARPSMPSRRHQVSTPTVPGPYPEGHGLPVPGRAARR